MGVVWLGLCAGVAQAQTLEVLLSPPGEQFPAFNNGLKLEDFGTGATTSIAGTSGTWAVGGFAAATGRLAQFDQFGGAGGSGRYLGVAGGPITVNLVPGYEYVGFWWSAGDPTNAITFFDDGGNELIRFTTADINTLLEGGGNIVAVNGLPYPKADYFGNPNSSPRGNSAEPYAYVNLILSNASVKFGKIEIRGSNFELDNLAVAHPDPAPPGTWVRVKDYKVSLTANDDAYATVANRPVSGTAGANDPAATDTTAVYAVGSGPSSGTISGWNSANGAFVYTPNSGFSGTDTFTYARCRADEPAMCDTATVTILVIDAVNDSATTSVGTPISGGTVAGNDTVPGGTYSTSGTSDKGGTVTMVPATGVYNYTPNAGFAGMDSFQYRACLPSPNQAVCDTAAVFIGIPPDARDDMGSTTVGTPLSGSVKGNDLGAGVPGASFAKVIDPGHGTATVSPDGAYTYTPGAGYTGADGFSYSLCVPNSANPGQPLCDGATVNLTVLGATDDSAVTKVNAPVSGNVAINDGTVPAGATFAKTSDPVHGTVVLNPDGAYTYTPAAGYGGPDSFTYSLCTADATPVCSPATVSLYVLKAEDDTGNALFDTPLNGNLKANDTVPADATYTKSLDPSHGVVTVNADGSYSYAPTRSYFGADSFEYQVCAPNGAAAPVCTTARVELTVAAPVPTVSQWGLMLMAGLLGLFGVRRRIG